MNRAYKVVWRDQSGLEHERVFAINPDKAERADIRQAGIAMAVNSQFGFKSIVRVVPCYESGSPRRPDI